MAGQRDDKEVEFLGALSVASHLTDEVVRLRTFTAAAASPPQPGDDTGVTEDQAVVEVEGDSDEDDGAEPQPDGDQDGGVVADDDSDDDTGDDGKAPHVLVCSDDDDGDPGDSDSDDEEDE